jgi:hypothetical protein
MHEWEIFMQSEKTAETLGFVWANEETEALNIAFERYEIVSPSARQMVAVLAVPPTT